MLQGGLSVHTLGKLLTMKSNSYDLADFTPYTGKVCNGMQKVLVWNKKHGYYFTEFGFVVLDAETKIIAQEV